MPAVALRSVAGSVRGAVGSEVRLPQSGSVAAGAARMVGVRRQHGQLRVARARDESAPWFAIRLLGLDEARRDAPAWALPVVGVLEVLGARFASLGSIGGADAVIGPAPGACGFVPRRELALAVARGLNELWLLGLSDSDIGHCCFLADLEWAGPRMPTTQQL
jgi:hypothetical protein